LFAACGRDHAVIEVGKAIVEELTDWSVVVNTENVQGAFRIDLWHGVADGLRGFFPNGKVDRLAERAGDLARGRGRHCQSRIGNEWSGGNAKPAGGCRGGAGSGKMIVAAVWPFHRAGHACLKIQRDAPGNWSGIFSLAVNVTAITFPFAEVTVGLPVQFKYDYVFLIGPKHVIFALKNGI
jgi:hypothetical protein